MEIKQSTRKNKKYMVKVNDKWIHFGDVRYAQFRDSTPLKLYSIRTKKEEKTESSVEIFRKVYLVDSYLFSLRRMRSTVGYSLISNGLSPKRCL